MYLFISAYFGERQKQIVITTIPSIQFITYETKFNANGLLSADNHFK